MIGSQADTFGSQILQYLHIFQTQLHPHCSGTPCISGLLLTELPAALGKAACCAGAFRGPWESSRRGMRAVVGLAWPGLGLLRSPLRPWSLPIPSGSLSLPTIGYGPCQAAWSRRPALMLLQSPLLMSGASLESLPWWKMSPWTTPLQRLSTICEEI